MRRSLVLFNHLSATLRFSPVLPHIMWTSFSNKPILPPRVALMPRMKFFLACRWAAGLPAQLPLRLCQRSPLRRKPEVSPPAENRRMLNWDQLLCLMWWNPRSFWILDSKPRILDSLSVKLGFRIPIVSGSLNSLRLFLIPKHKVPDYTSKTCPDSLSWGKILLTHLYNEARVTFSIQLGESPRRSRVLFQADRCTSWPGFYWSPCCHYTEAYIQSHPKTPAARRQEDR